MKLHTKILLVIVSGAVITGVFAGCKGAFFNHSPEKKAEWIVEEITDTLELSDIQIEKLNQLKVYALNLRGEMKERHESTYQDFISVLSKPTIDQEKLLSMVKQKTQIVEDKSPEIIAMLADFYDSLNTEQQQKILEEIKSHKKNKHHHHF